MWYSYCMFSCFFSSLPLELCEVFIDFMSIVLRYCGGYFVDELVFF